jgi:hypothetical protein
VTNLQPLIDALRLKLDEGIPFVVKASAAPTLPPDTERVKLERVLKMEADYYQTVVARDAALQTRAATLFTVLGGFGAAVAGVGLLGVKNESAAIVSDIRSHTSIVVVAVLAAASYVLALACLAVSLFRGIAVPIVDWAAEKRPTQFKKLPAPREAQLMLDAIEEKTDLELLRMMVWDIHQSSMKTVSLIASRVRLQFLGACFLVLLALFMALLAGLIAHYVDAVKLP